MRSDRVTSKKHRKNSPNSNASSSKSSILTKTPRKPSGTRRLRKGRLEEIQEVISAKARELGYDLVIDSSQDVLLPRTPTVLYTNGKNDITAVIIELLNKDAVGKYKPAEPAKPAESTEPAPEKPAAPAPIDQ